MFNLDLTEWLNQPDHSNTINFPATVMSTLPGYDLGKTQLASGTMTITSRTVVVNNGPPSSDIKKPAR